jgi:signal peptide peptidase SppA
MRYLHIVSAFAAEAWALQPEKLETIAAFLAHKAAGGEFTAEEIEARISNRRASDVARVNGDIAVLPMIGVISQRMDMLAQTSGGVSTDQLGRDLAAAVADDTIKAIVLDVDSPGGGVFGVQELASQIKAARDVKPVIAQVNSRMASAAYWLGSQADEIVVTPGGEAGSIGVYTVHEDITKMLDQAGVKATIVQGGENKTELSGLSPLSESAKAALQARVDTNYGAFVRAVADGRKTTQSMVKDRFGQGRMYGADELVSRGMADRVATMDETIARLGGQPARASAGRSMRSAFASGETPQLKTIEEYLRDGGFSNDLATAFVSLGKGAFRPRESGDEANRKKALEAIPRLQAQIDEIAKTLTLERK